MGNIDGCRNLIRLANAKMTRVVSTVMVCDHTTGRGGRSALKFGQDTTRTPPSKYACDKIKCSGFICGENASASKWWYRGRNCTIDHVVRYWRLLEEEIEGPATFSCKSAWIARVENVCITCRCRAIQRPQNQRTFGSP